MMFRKNTIKFIVLLVVTLAMSGCFGTKSQSTSEEALVNLAIDKWIAGEVEQNDDYLDEAFADEFVFAILEEGEVDETTFLKSEYITGLHEHMWDLGIAMTEMKITGRKTTINGNNAIVTGYLYAKVEDENTVVEQTGEVELELTKINGKWKITRFAQIEPKVKFDMKNQEEE